jgi:hypothetical protein
MNALWSLALFGRYPFLRVKQFISNPSYIGYYVKRLFWYKYISYRYVHLFQGVTFLSAQETLDALLTGGYSIARFSDGEIDLLTGMSVFDPRMSWSQPYSPALREALIRALTTEHPKLLVAHTSPYKFLATKTEAKKQGVSYTMWTDTRMILHRYLRLGVPYGDAHVFIQKDNPTLDWVRIKDFLKQRDVVVVTGGIEQIQHIVLGRRTYFVEAGKHDAFSRYAKIKESIETVFREKGLDLHTTLVMISLGPTASILSADFALRGYTVWDSGHIFKYAADKLV